MRSGWGKAFGPEGGIHDPRSLDRVPEAIDSYQRAARHPAKCPRLPKNSGFLFGPSKDTPFCVFFEGASFGIGVEGTKAEPRGLEGSRSLKTPMC